MSEKWISTRAKSAKATIADLEKVLASDKNAEYKAGYSQQAFKKLQNDIDEILNELDIKDTFGDG